MLTALISLVSGIITGAVPEILKEIRESREAKREREWLELNHRLQMEREKAGAEDKMRLAEANLAAEEIRAMREHLTAIVEAHAQPTGIKWIDGFNALLRPAASTGVIVLLFWVSVVYVHGVTSQYMAGTITVEELHTAIWGSMIGEAIVAVLGFLFGYRGAVKVAKT